MTDKRKPYKTYTKEFKIEAVRLMTGSDTSPAQLAMELGIRRNQLYKWKEQLEDKGDDAFPNKLGRPRKEEQSDMATLRQENKRLKEEGGILKKAAVDSSNHCNTLFNHVRWCLKFQYFSGALI